jgi:hypothetical protein
VLLPCIQDAFFLDFAVPRLHSPITHLSRQDNSDSAFREFNKFLVIDTPLPSWCRPQCCNANIGATAITEGRGSSEIADGKAPYSQTAISTVWPS